MEQPLFTPSTDSIAATRVAPLTITSTRPAPAIFWGTVVVGVLDILLAAVYYQAPILGCFRGVASGVLGRAAFQGGLPASLLGAALHFFIAFSIVSVYYLASRKIPALTQRPVMWGLLYGLGEFVFMNYFVVPLSAAGSFDRLPTSPTFIFWHALGQAVLVGLPSALAAKAAGPPARLSS